MTVDEIIKKGYTITARNYEGTWYTLAKEKYDVVIFVELDTINQTIKFRYPVDLVFEITSGVLGFPHKYFDNFEKNIFKYAVALENP
jgi:hypothetical protein